MGLIYTDLMPVTAWAFVDTDAMFLCIPANTTAQLKLKEYEEREIIIADRNIKIMWLCRANPTKILPTVNILPELYTRQHVTRTN